MKKFAFICLALFLLIGVWKINYNTVFVGYGISESYNISHSSSRIKITEFSKTHLRKTGESFCISVDKFNFDNFLHTFDAKIEIYEVINGGKNYYLSSKNIKFTKKIRDKYINIQVFIGENCVTVGTPIIFGSF